MTVTHYQKLNIVQQIVYRYNLYGFADAQNQSKF